jgi:hypothetical protein
MRGDPNLRLAGDAKVIRESPYILTTIEADEVTNSAKDL